MKNTSLRIKDSDIDEKASEKHNLTPDKHQKLETEPCIPLDPISALVSSLSLTHTDGIQKIEPNHQEVQQYESPPKQISLGNFQRAPDYDEASANETGIQH